MLKKLSPYIGWITFLALIVAGGATTWIAGPRTVLRWLGIAEGEHVAEAAEADEPFKVSGGTIVVPVSAAQTMSLETMVARPQKAPLTLRLTGRTGLNTETVTHIRGQFPGRVVDLGPALGSFVHGPEDLAKFGAPTTMCIVESTDLAQAKSDYAKAKVTLEVDQDNVRRTKQLVEAKVLADKFLLDAQSQVKKDQADYDAARQKLLVFGLKDNDLPEIEKQQGRERMVYAIPCPRSGIITEKNVTRGELADPSVNLFTIADLSKLWIWGDVYERDRRKVREGQKMKVIVASHPNEPRECVVEWISPVLDANTRSIRIRGALDNRDGRLLADMYCTIILQIEEPSDSIIVPAEAVVRKGDVPYVFVRKSASDGSAAYERRLVKVEPIDSGIGFDLAAANATPSPLKGVSQPPTGVDGRRPRVEYLRVTEGLAPNEVVVVHGALGLLAEMEQHEQEMVTAQAR